MNSTGARNNLQAADSKTQETEKEQNSPIEPLTPIVYTYQPFENQRYQSTLEGEMSSNKRIPT